MIEKNLLFHNGEVKRGGRNCHLGIVTFPGLKSECVACKENTFDHLHNHLTPHLQCKHCLYELKTAEDSLYWTKVCKICGKEFSSQELKMQHIKRHEFPRQVCSFCGLTFTSKFNLHRHMVEQHNTMQRSSQNYECYKCKKIFLSRGDMGRHIQGIHRESLSTLSHSRSENQNDHRCDICDKVFSRQSTLEEHLKLHEQDNTQRCEYCGKIFSTVSNLRRHLQIHDKEQEFKNTSYSCKYCGKHFSTDYNLERHINIHTGDQKPFQCDKCEESFGRKDKLDVHIISVHEKRLYACDICGNTFSRADKLKTHRNKRHSS